MSVFATVKTLFLITLGHQVVVKGYINIPTSIGSQLNVVVVINQLRLILMLLLISPATSLILRIMRDFIFLGLPVTDWN